MPRGRKKVEVEAESSPPKTTRSSRAKKKVEVEEVPNPSKVKEVKKGTRSSKVVDVETKDGKEELPNLSNDVKKTRKTRKVAPAPTSAEIEETVPEKTRAKGRKTSVSKVSPAMKVPASEADEVKDSPRKPRKVKKVNQSSKFDDVEKKEEEPKQSKEATKTRKARKVVSVQIEEAVPEKTRGKGRKISDTKDSPVIKKNQKKRKLSDEIIEAELTDSKKKAKVSPVKKKNSPKKRFRSIASGLSRDGKVLQKDAPRKTLGNLDILGLLDEDPGEANEDELEPEPEKERNPVNISSSFSLTKGKVPVWRQERQELAKTVPTAGNDVFDPMNYGEDEFGPEDNSVCPPKKKQRKKKKDTKAILVFGKNQQSNGVKKVVKEAHNLKTPGAAKKTKRAANRKPLPPLGMFSSEMEKSAVPEVTISTFTSDVSTGAQNYFHSDLQFDNVDLPLPPPETDNLQVPGKNFTPKVPKNLSRLKSGSCSTPNVTASSKKKAPTTVKEQLKNAFGFDDTEDER